MSLENKMLEKRRELSSKIEEANLRIQNAKQQILQLEVQIDQMVGAIMVISELLEAEVEEKAANLTDNDVK